MRETKSAPPNQHVGQSGSPDAWTLLHLQSTRQTSVPIPKFALSCRTLWSELRNQRDTSKYVILVWFWI